MSSEHQKPSLEYTTSNCSVASYAQLMAWRISWYSFLNKELGSQVHLANPVDQMRNLEP